MKKKPLSFNSLGLALKYVESKLSIQLKYWKKHSQILDQVLHQKKLSDFS